MLYIPWRDEEKDTIASFPPFTARYQTIQNQLEQKRKQFEPFRNAVQLAENFLSEQPDLDDSWDTVAPTTEHMNRGDKEQYESTTSSPAPQESYDIGQDFVEKGVGRTY